VEFNFRPIPDGGMLAIYRDITQLKEQQAAAEQARATAEAAQSLLDDALVSMDGGVGIWDENERLIRCNSAYRALHHDIPEIVSPATTLEVAARAAMRAQYEMVGRPVQEEEAERRGARFLDQQRRGDAPV